MFVEIDCRIVVFASSVGHENYADVEERDYLQSLCIAHESRHEN